MDAKYSVLMSIYIEEEPDYFDQSLKSMVNQTLLPDEIVLVKDGKLTQGLEDVITRYNQKYPQLFTIVTLKENIGLGRALDVGIKHCRNELIARMDTDDISLPNRCNLQVEKFKQNPELSIVGTMTDEFYDTPDNIISSRNVPTTNDEIYKFMKRRSPFNHPTVMYKKTDVIRCGGYGKMRRKQDLDLFSRMINNGCKAENLDLSLVLFRSNEESFSRRQSWSYVKSYIDVQFEIWKRGHCSFIDLTYVTLGQFFIYIAPRSLLKVISNELLRN